MPRIGDQGLTIKQALGRNRSAQFEIVTKGAENFVCANFQNAVIACIRQQIGHFVGVLNIRRQVQAQGMVAFFALFPPLPADFLLAVNFENPVMAFVDNQITVSTDLAAVACGFDGLKQMKLRIAITGQTPNLTPTGVTFKHGIGLPIGHQNMKIREPEHIPGLPHTRQDFEIHLPGDVIEAVGIDQQKAAFVDIGHGKIA